MLKDTQSTVLVVAVAEATQVRDNAQEEYTKDQTELEEHLVGLKKDEEQLAEIEYEIGLQDAIEKLKRHKCPLWRKTSQPQRIAVTP